VKALIGSYSQEWLEQPSFTASPAAGNPHETHLIRIIILMFESPG